MRTAALAFLVALLLCVARLAHGEGKLLPDEQNNVEVYRKVSPSVVNITTVTLRRDFFFDVVPQQGMGSGILIRADGFVLTNEHVIGQAEDVEVTLHDKTTFPAKVVGADPDSDLAILKIDPKGKALSAVEYGDAGSLAVGQKVLAIGNPFGLGGSLSVGIISSLGRDIRTQTNRLVKNVIQTDAAINPGNSGGPLLDSSGRMIGVNTQIITKSGGSEGIGFAISIDMVRKIAPQLIQYGQVLRPDLGINAVGMSSSLLQALGIPAERGVMILEMDKRGAAAKAGLRSANREVVLGFRRIPVGGDVITQVDNVPVATLTDLLDHLYDKKVGDTIVVHYFRGNVKRTANVKLALPPGLKAKSL